MQHPTKKNIEEVMKRYLRVCCGTCMSVCPQDAIVIAEIPGSLLVPTQTLPAIIREGKCS